MDMDGEMQPCSSKIDLIACGGQGSVRRSETTLASATKTIKCKTEDERARAGREVTIFQSLRNKNIVLYYGHTWDIKTRTMSIDMELCGPSLRHYIKDEDFVFGEKIRLSFVHDMLSGLEYLKREKVLHRDIKPENILVTNPGPLMGTLKLCDFGISNVNNTITGDIVRGTDGYRAPEVHFPADFSYASEMFAVGVTVWEINNKSSAEYLKRELLKEDGPMLESLVYKCTTEAADSRIKVEDALRLVSDEKQKVVGKEPVDFGRLFPKPKIVSAPDLSQGTAAQQSFSPKKKTSTSSFHEPYLPNSNSKSGHSDKGVKGSEDAKQNSTNITPKKRVAEMKKNYTGTGGGQGKAVAPTPNYICTLFLRKEESVTGVEGGLESGDAGPTVVVDPDPVTNLSTSMSSPVRSADYDASLLKVKKELRTPKESLEERQKTRSKLQRTRLEVSDHPTRNDIEKEEFRYWKAKADTAELKLMHKNENWKRNDAESERRMRKIKLD